MIFKERHQTDLNTIAKSHNNGTLASLLVRQGLSKIFCVGERSVMGTLVPAVKYGRRVVLGQSTIGILFASRLCLSPQEQNGSNVIITDSIKNRISQKHEMEKHMTNLIR